MAVLKSHGLPVAAAIVVGFVLLPVAHDEYSKWATQREKVREQAQPVVTMRGHVVQRDGDSVWINISGTKHRECRYLGLTAYSLTAEGVRHDANIERADGIAYRGSTKAPGTYDIGVWRVWPIKADAARALVSVEHDCSGVTVRSVIAEVPI